MSVELNEKNKGDSFLLNFIKYHFKSNENVFLSCEHL